MQEASLEDQRKAIRQYAADNNFSLVREFCDDAISGKTAEDRPSFQSVVDFARTNKNEPYTLLVYDVTRFGRFENPKEATYWEVELEKNNMSVHYVTEGFNNDGSLGSYITKVVKDAEASEYIKKLSKTTSRGIRSAAERGYWTRALAPYGYSRAVVEPSTNSIEHVLKKDEANAIKGKRIKLVRGSETEIEILREIFHMYADREQGLSSITNYLNHNHIPTPSGKGHWHKAGVRNILRNQTYLGMTVLYEGSGDEVVVEGTHERLIDESTFNRAQRRLHEASFATRGGYTTQYLLTALLECGHCGYTLHGAGVKNGKLYYKCNGYSNRGKEVCHSPIYPAELLETPVIENIEEQISSANWPSIVQQSIDLVIGRSSREHSSKTQEAQQQYEKNKRRVENLLASIADGVPRKTAIHAIQRIEREQEDLEKILRNADTETHARSTYEHQARFLTELPQNWTTYLAQATPQEEKRLVRFFLQKATVNYAPPNITYNFYSTPCIDRKNTEPPITQIKKKLKLRRK